MSATTKRKLSRDHSDYPADPIFFTKWQIIIGAELLNVGRLDRGIVWQVYKIMSYPKHRLRGVSVRKVQQLQDVVHLRRSDTGETRVISFSSLSYLAHWRMANYRHNEVVDAAE